MTKVSYMVVVVTVVGILYLRINLMTTNAYLLACRLSENVANNF